MWKRENSRGPFRHAAEDREQSAGEDANQDGAISFSRHQDERDGKAYASSLYFRIRKTSEAYKGGGISHNQLGVSQAHESDEHADAPGGCMLQAVGDTVHDLLANVSDRENQEKNA